MTFAVAIVNGNPTGKLPVANTVVTRPAVGGSGGDQARHRCSAGRQRRPVGRDHLRESGNNWSINTGNGYYGACSSIRAPGSVTVA